MIILKELGEFIRYNKGEVFPKEDGMQGLLLGRSCRKFCVVLLALGLVACADSGTENAPPQGPPPEVQTGVLVDSFIAGIRYTTPTHSGITNEQGEFSYLAGEMVTFSIGDITFPAVAADSVVTPYDIFGTRDLTNVAMVNVLRLLQSLDTDGIASNGIVIDPMAHTAAIGLSVQFDSYYFDEQVANLVFNSGSVRRSLIDKDSAITEFLSTINTMYAGTPIDWKKYTGFSIEGDHQFIGKEWIYSVSYDQGFSDFFSYQLTKVIKDEQEAYLRTYTDTIEHGAGYHDYLHRDLESGYTVLGLGDSNVELMYDWPMRFYCPMLNVECYVSEPSFTGGAVVGGGGAFYTFNVKVVPSVTVPSGTFGDCIQVTQNEGLGYGYSAGDREITYCAGAGEVINRKVGVYTARLGAISQNENDQFFYNEVPNYTTVDRTYTSDISIGFSVTNNIPFADSEVTGFTLPGLTGDFTLQCYYECVITEANGSKTVSVDLGIYGLKTGDSAGIEIIYADPIRFNSWTDIVAEIHDKTYGTLTDGTIVPLYVPAP